MSKKKVKTERDGFGPTLRRLREEQGISLRKFAEKIGLSAPYLSQLETGHHEPPPDYQILSIGYALGVDPDILFGAAGRVPGSIELPRSSWTAAEAIKLFRAIGEDEEIFEKVKETVDEISEQRGGLEKSSMTDDQRDRHREIGRKRAARRPQPSDVAHKKGKAKKEA